MICTKMPNKNSQNKTSKYYNKSNKHDIFKGTHMITLIYSSYGILKLSYEN